MGSPDDAACNGRRIDGAPLRARRAPPRPLGGALDRGDRGAGARAEAGPLPGRGAVRVRVVIADDNLLVRRGIAALLAEAGIDVAAQADCAEDLLRDVDAHDPDV